MKTPPAVITPSSSETSSQSSSPPSYRQQMDIEDTRPADTASGSALGCYIMLLLLFGFIGLVIFAWALHIPSYMWPWDHTRLANRVPALLKLAQIVSQLSCYLPILIMILVGCMYTLINKVSKAGTISWMTCMPFLVLLSWFLALMCYEERPLTFALKEPYVYHDGTISMKGHNSFGTFTRTNGTAVCSYDQGTGSPFKGIQYKIEENAVSFEIKCLPDSLCGHGLITYSDQEVWMDFFWNYQMWSVSSLAPEFHATPGPWQNKTSLYSSSGEKTFMIERDKQVKVYGSTQLWRAFGSCWSAVILSKWPQN